MSHTISLEGFSAMRRWDAIAAGAVIPAALAAARQVSVRVVNAAIRSGELAAFKPIDSARWLVTPDAAATWRAAITTTAVPESYSVAETAARLGVTADVLWRAIRERKLKAARPGGRGDLRITAADALKWFWRGVSLDNTGAARRMMRGSAQANS